MRAIIYDACSYDSLSALFGSKFSPVASWTPGNVVYTSGGLNIVADGLAWATW